MQDGFALPSRLGVSAADCFLAISGALTKEAKLKDKKTKFNTKAKDQAITIVQCLTVDKKVKSDSKSLLMSKFEREYTLWHHIDDLICLVQRLHSVSYALSFCLNHFVLDKMSYTYIHVMKLWCTQSGEFYQISEQ